MEGLLGEVVTVTHGSAATGPVSIGGTAVPVENLTDFASDGGRVDVAGVVYDYTGVDTTGVDADGAGGSVLLDSPLTVAVREFDPVSLLIGDVPWVDFYAVVDSVDDEAGEPAWVPLATREERLAWPVGAYDPPLPVVVADDLSRIVTAPGAPRVDQSYIDTPFIDLYRTSNLTIADSAPGAFTTLSTWSTEARWGMGHAAGVVTPDALGLYEFVFTVRWAGNSSGRRGIRVMSTIAGVEEEVTYITASPPDADPFTQQVVVIHQVAAGESFHTAVRQTTGAGLDMFASGTTLQVVRLQA